MVLPAIRGPADAHPARRRGEGSPRRDVLAGRPRRVAEQQGGCRTASDATRAGSQGGVIVRDPRGEPTGLFKDTAVALVTRAMPQPTREERARALRLAIRDAQERGITSVQDLGGSTADFEVYDEARRAGDLTVRVYAGLPISSPGGACQSHRARRARQTLRGRCAVEGGTGRGLRSTARSSRRRPRCWPHTSREATTTGMLKLDASDLNRIVTTLDSRGWQIAVDAAGDRAVRLALDAYQSAAVTNTHAAGSPRHRIEGVEVVDADDLPRFGALGVIASLQPLHASTDRLGSGAQSRPRSRVARLASRSLAAAGARPRVRHGLAAPAVDPLAGLNAAVNRGTSRKRRMRRRHRRGAARRGHPVRRRALALKSAINAWTSGAAWASFDEHRKGMIKPGMLADLVVLSSDILKDAPEALATTEVDVTIFDGKIVYERNRRHSDQLERRQSTEDRPVDGRPTLHHEPDPAKRRDLARRIAVHRDQIREQTLLHLTDARLHVQNARRDRRGALERVDRRHAVVRPSFSSSRALSPCVNTPTSLPLRIVTPASSAALKLARLRAIDGGLGASPFFQPAYCDVASPAASVGQSATLCSFISRNTSGVPASPCSIVSTPASTARRIPSGRRRVGRDRPSAAARGLDDRLQLLDREGRRRLAARAPAIVRVDLDPVGAVADLIADDADERRRRRPPPPPAAPATRARSLSGRSCRSPRSRG